MHTNRASKLGILRSFPESTVMSRNVFGSLAPPYSSPNRFPCPALCPYPIVSPCAELRSHLVAPHTVMPLRIYYLRDPHVNPTSFTLYFNANLVDFPFQSLASQWYSLANLRFALEYWLLRALSIFLEHRCLPPLCKPAHAILSEATIGDHRTVLEGSQDVIFFILTALT
jgi:hypothetical protein